MPQPAVSSQRPYDGFEHRIPLKVTENTQNSPAIGRVLVFGRQRSRWLELTHVHSGECHNHKITAVRNWIKRPYKLIRDRLFQEAETPNRTHGFG